MNFEVQMEEDMQHGPTDSTRWRKQLTWHAHKVGWKERRRDAAGYRLQISQRALRVGREQHEEDDDYEEGGFSSKRNIVKCGPREWIVLAQGPEV